MSENKKIYAGETIMTKESSEIINQMNRLIARHNTLCSVETAINNSDEILAICNEVMTDMEGAGNASIAGMLALTIEAANAKIHDLKDESTNDVELREKVRKLERENKELKLRLSTIAEILEARGGR